MSAKDVRFSSDARDRMLHGIEILPLLKTEWVRALPR